MGPLAQVLTISANVQARGVLVRHIGRALRMAVLLHSAVESLVGAADAALPDRCLVLSQDASLLAGTSP